MSHSSHDPSSSREFEFERFFALSERRSEGEPRPSSRPVHENDPGTPWGALALLYKVPARWVRAYLSDAEDEPHWNESDREFLSGPFSTDLHPPDA